MIKLGLGTYEHAGVFIMNLENGTVMQVKLEPDKIGVRTRAVPVGDMEDTTSNDPEWLTAYDMAMSEWISNDSPVWAWLKAKGIDQAGVMKRLFKTK